jgi:hypothetical protein
MSETHFSALDWRPSKKRASYPRVRHCAGQKVAPPAFLAAARVSGFGSGKHRICAHCGRVAMRESTVCRQHGGSGHASKKRPYVRSARSNALAGQRPQSASAPGGDAPD